MNALKHQKRLRKALFFHNKLKLNCYAIHYPDSYIDHMTKKEMEAHAGMNYISIAEKIINFYNI